MFCGKCGKPIENDFVFCQNCGAKITHSQPLPSPKKRKSLKIIFFSAISIILCVSILLFTNIFLPKRADFDFSFNEEEIEKFLKAVMSNVQAEYVEIESIEENEGMHGDFSYVVILEIKLSGHTKESIKLLFDNKDEKDYINSISITFYDSYPENHINCVIEIIEAIEVTISGDSYIRNEFNEFRFVNSGRTFADYQLTEDVRCTLISRSNWGEYSLYRN